VVTGKTSQTNIEQPYQGDKSYFVSEIVIVHSKSTPALDEAIRSKRLEVWQDSLSPPWCLLCCFLERKTNIFHNLILVTAVLKFVPATKKQNLPAKRCMKHDTILQCSHYDMWERMRGMGICFPCSHIYYGNEVSTTLPAILPCQLLGLVNSHTYRQRRRSKCTKRNKKCKLLSHN